MSDDAGDEDELLPAYRGEEYVQAVGGSPHHVGFLAAAYADLGGQIDPFCRRQLTNAERSAAASNDLSARSQPPARPNG